MNVVVLHGVLSSPSTVRTLPSGDRLVAYEVTIRAEGEPTGTVPVVWIDPPASTPELPAGTPVVVTGRVRRRFFRAGGTTASRTEVVAHQVLPERQAKRVAAALDAARRAIELEVAR